MEKKQFKSGGISSGPTIMPIYIQELMDAAINDFIETEDTEDIEFEEVTNQLPQPKE